MINAQTGLNGVQGPFAVSNVDLTVEDRVWLYGQTRHGEITAHFSALKSRKPSLFNGPMLVLDRWEIVGDVFCGRFCRTDFASFLHWRDAYAAGKLADLAGARNLFGTAAVRSSDGDLLLGEMALHTANAARIYPPCGSLDPADVFDMRIDIDGSMTRELEEETGLKLDTADAAPGYLVWFDGPRVAVVRAYRCRYDAQTLRARIEAFLAVDEVPELRAIHFVAGEAGLNLISGVETGRVPDYTRAMVRWFFDRI